MAEINELDDPKTTIERADMLKNKKVLFKLYTDWYNFLLKKVDDLPEGKILEIGSGGGFLKELLPEVITSDVMDLPNVDMIFSAEKIPLEDNSLSCIFMVDVLHHIPDCTQFFAEAERCLVPGGKIIMSEPASTPFSRFFYKRFHHEPFVPEAGWKLDTEGGPLSNANGAIPSIVFRRDIDKFHSTYKTLKLETLKFHSPFMYFLSGGFSYPSLIPSFMYGFFRFVEKLFLPTYSLIAMFQLIEVKKTSK